MNNRSKKAMLFGSGIQTIVLNLFLAELSAKLEFTYDLSQNYGDWIILSVKIQVTPFLNL